MKVAVEPGRDNDDHRTNHDPMFTLVALAMLGVRLPWLDWGFRWMKRGWWLGCSHSLASLGLQKVHRVSGQRIVTHAVTHPVQD